MNKKTHYAWVIASVAFFMIFVSLGLCNSPHGLYQVPITTDTGISRSQFSSISTFRFLTSASFYFIFGTLNRKFGLKKLAIIGFFILGIAFFTLSLGSYNNAWIFCVGAVLWGAGGTLTGNNVASTLINNWFNKNNGLVLGIVMASSGVGGAIFSKVISNFISKFGWRYSYRISAILLIIALIAVAILIVEKPEEKGLLPYGYIKKDTNVTEEKEVQTGISLSEGLRKPAFYIILFYAFLAGALTNPVYVSVPAQMYDKGFGPFAATVTSIIFVSIAVGKITLGFVKDKFGLSVTMCISFATNIAGLILLLTAKSSINYLLFSFIFGFSMPLENLIPPLITKQIFGKKYYTSFIGIIMAFVSIGISIGNKLMGLFYDRFGSYSQIFTIELICSVMAFIAIQIAIRISPKYD